MTDHVPPGTRAAQRRLRRFATVLVACLGVIAGCSGVERSPEDDFSDRLQGIREEGSERWDRVATRAADLEPDEPISVDLEQAIAELLAFQRRVVSELREITAPEAAAEEIEMLIAALEARTEAFQEALEARRFTGEQFARIEQAGDQIDVVFRQLGAKGFLPDALDSDPH